jgi:hypothetical protein
MEKLYRREHAEALLEPCNGDGVRWTIDDHGVWPAVDFKECKRQALDAEYVALSWKPVKVFENDPEAPDGTNTPGLPFPFSGADLAAFFLGGVGVFAAEFYGEWADGPDQDAINEIDPGNNYARQAVRDAYEAYRAAKALVGALNMDAQAKYDKAHKEYREKASKTNLEEFERAEQEWGTGYEAWLSAMVRELLKAAVKVRQHPTGDSDGTPAKQQTAHQDAPGRNRPGAPKQSTQDRQSHRWQLCIDAGLPMPQDTYANLPRGIGVIAQQLKITRQALAQDLNSHRERLFSR